MTRTALVVSLVGSAFVRNAHRPLQGRYTMLLGFFPAWFVTELAHWLLLWQALFILLLARQGLLSDLFGWAALAVMVANAAGLLRLWLRARGAGRVMREALDGFADHAPDMPRFPPAHVRFPFTYKRPGVVTERHVEFHRIAAHRLRLDIVSSLNVPPTGTRDGLKPVLLQIHGGGWTTGFKEHQARPLLWHMADAGWVCFDADYRLSPRAGYPDHLVDVKRAVAWLRENAAQYGADPDFVCITGGSAGGHLCALAALTANRPEFQPGFEDYDTTVHAAVPFYGVYDLTNRLGAQVADVVPRFYEPVVVKDYLADAPEKFAGYSPTDQVHADAPPFLVIHGDKDTLARVEDARHFVEQLRRVSRNPVLYAEFPGAHHAFEVFASIRAGHAVEGVERFLSAVHTRYLATVGDGAPAPI